MTELRLAHRKSQGKLTSHEEIGNNSWQALNRSKLPVGDWKLEKVRMMSGQPLIYDCRNSPKSQAALLRDSWGNWLVDLGDQVGGWDWWVSLTFRDQQKRMGGHWNKAGWAYTGSAWCQWIKELELMQFQTCPINEIPAREKISWVRCRETQKGRGIDHFHALLAGVSDLRRTDAWRWWFSEYGIARIVPYDRNLGAGHYLCKYVTKELGDIQFSDTFG